MFSSVLRNGLRGLLSAAALSLLVACGGGGGSAPSTPTTTQPLSVQVTGAGRVTSTPAGLDCSSTCSAPFEVSSTVSLTAQPATGFRFLGWGGACTGAGACNVSLDQARTVSAGFEQIPIEQNFTLTVAVSGDGSVASQPAGINCGADCSEVYAANTQVTLTATPGANQSFAGWSGACSGASSCVITMNQASSVSASFVTVTASQFTLQTSVTGNGQITSAPAGISCGSTCSALFNAGTQVILTATPAAGQVFNGWTGACSGAAATCSLQLTQDRSAQASFAVAPPAAAAWQPGQLLETSNDFNVASTNSFTDVPTLVAVAPNGDAITMWEQSDGQPDGQTRKVYSRRYTAATAVWESAIVVPGLTAGTNVFGTDFGPGSQVVNGQLFLDASGVATWVNPRMLTRRNTAAGGWSAPFSPPVAVDFSNGLSSAVLDSSGNIGVLISSRNEGFGDGAVFTAVLVAGSDAWSSFTRIQALSGAVALEGELAQLAISNSGPSTSIATAIWREKNPGDNNYSMKASRKAVGSAWTTPVNLEELFTNVETIKPAVAMDAAGNTIAMWCQGDKLYSNIYSMSTNAWLGAVEADNCSGPIRLAMNAQGQAVATWSTSPANLRSMQYTIATGWTTPVTVDTYNVSRSLAIDDSGKAVMTYVYSVPGSGLFDLVSRTLNFGGTWGERTALEQANSDVNSPIFAMNPSGKGVVIWTQSDSPTSSARNSLWGAVLR
jgi:hypothetical protein